MFLTVEPNDENTLTTLGNTEILCIQHLLLDDKTSLSEKSLQFLEHSTMILCVQTGNILKHEEIYIEFLA